MNTLNHFPIESLKNLWLKVLQSRFCLLASAILCAWLYCYNSSHKHDKRDIIAQHGRPLNDTVPNQIASELVRTSVGLSSVWDAVFFENSESVVLCISQSHIVPWVSPQETQKMSKVQSEILFTLRAIQKKYPKVVVCSEWVISIDKLDWYLFDILSRQYFFLNRKEFTWSRFARDLWNSFTDTQKKIMEMNLIKYGAQNIWYLEWGDLRPAETTEANQAAGDVFARIDRGEKVPDDEFVRIVLTNREKIAYEKVHEVSQGGNTVIVLIYWKWHDFLDDARDTWLTTIEIIPRVFEN